MKSYALMCALALVVVFGATAAGQAMESAPQLDTKTTTERHWGGRRSHRGWRGSRGGHWRGNYSHHGYYYFD